MKITDIEKFNKNDLISLINFCLEENIISLKDNSNIIINKRVKEKLSKEWVKKWNNLFPTASKTYDRTSKRDPLGGSWGVYSKLQKFVTEFDYDLETIYNATKMYLNEEKATNYKYTKRSGFFISKRPEPSRLAAACETYLEEGERISQRDSLLYGD